MVGQYDGVVKLALSQLTPKAPSLMKVVCYDARILPDGSRALTAAVDQVD